MPRIYSSCNDALDFCKRCFPKNETQGFVEFGSLGDGPDDRGNCFCYNADHPEYDGDPIYSCYKCGVLLREKDE